MIRVVLIANIIDSHLNRSHKNLDTPILEALVAVRHCNYVYVYIRNTINKWNVRRWLKDKSLLLLTRTAY